MSLSWLRLVSAAVGLLAFTPLQQVRARGLEELEKQLAQETQLALVERLTLAQHPLFAEAGARSAAAGERLAGAERLPDLELKYEQWGVPLRRPLALDRAAMLMFGLRQALPAPGARAANGRVLAEEAQIALHQREALARDLLLRVRRAYFDYYAADRVLQLHLEHVGVAEQVVAQVRSDYELGRGSQQDVLKVLVELSRLHNDLRRFVSSASRAVCC